MKPTLGPPLHANVPTATRGDCCAEATPTDPTNKQAAMAAMAETRDIRITPVDLRRRKDVTNILLRYDISLQLRQGFDLPRLPKRVSVQDAIQAIRDPRPRSGQSVPGRSVAATRSNCWSRRRASSRRR